MTVVEVTRTWLEMTRREDLRDDGDPAPAGVTLAPGSVHPDRYRRLYAGVGRAHHWRDRDAWSDQTLAAHLARPDVVVWVLSVDGDDAGYFELVRHGDGTVEIAYFGLAAAYHGRGLGRLLLTRAARAAWNWDAERVWLHTCTLDHPAALPNYRARGFRPFRTETYTTELPGA
jgi:GNAT superfamily N-acetyltransferase